MSNWNKDMTVREAFVKAFGPIDADMTCHIGGKEELTEAQIIKPVLMDVIGLYFARDGRWYSSKLQEPIGNDISNLPAWVFAEIGVFGEAFNKAVNE